jgi:hypothetical protein
MPRAAFALCLLAFASTASAQIAGKPAYEPVGRSDPFLSDGSVPGPSARRELRSVERRIERAREAGLVSGREARQMKREARAIGRLAHRYGRDGLSASERREIEARTQALKGRVGLPKRRG